MGRPHVPTADGAAGDPLHRALYVHRQDTPLRRAAAERGAAARLARHPGAGLTGPEYIENSKFEHLLKMNYAISSKTRGAGLSGDGSLAVCGKKSCHRGQLVTASESNRDTERTVTGVPDGDAVGEAVTVSGTDHGPVTAAEVIVSVDENPNTAHPGSKGDPVRSCVCAPERSGPEARSLRGIGEPPIADANPERNVHGACDGEATGRSPRRRDMPTPLDGDKSAPARRTGPWAPAVPSRRRRGQVTE